MSGGGGWSGAKRPLRLGRGRGRAPEQVVREQSRARDRRRHRHDRTERDQEAQLGGDAEADDSGTSGTEHLRAHGGRETAGVEGTTGEFSGEQATGEDDAGHRCEHTADEGEQADHEREQRHQDAEHDQSQALADRGPQPCLAGGFVAAERTLDTLPDALVERVADREGEGGEHGASESERGDEDDESETYAQRLTPRAAPAVGERGYPVGDRAQCEAQRDECGQQHRPRDEGGDESQRHELGVGLPHPEALQQGADADPELTQHG